ncbi:MAG TPA: SDR family oxidoreductase [Candidatus Obscuribacterales bacterium]
MSDDRVAVVTGANRGLGFETARQLAVRGLRVIVTAREPKSGKEAVDELNLGANKRKISFHLLDVTSQKSIRQLALSVRKDFGRLDVLVNNAGVLLDRHKGGEPTNSIMDADMDKIRLTMETNVYGPLMLCQELIPLMKEHNYGRIVNVSSGLGQLAFMGRGYTGYRLSKAALNALTCIVADEVKNANILVNACCPGWVRTDMGGKNATRSPAEGADTIVWLATLPDGGPSGGFFRDRERQPW